MSQQLFEACIGNVGDFSAKVGLQSPLLIGEFIRSGCLFDTSLQTDIRKRGPYHNPVYSPLYFKALRYIVPVTEALIIKGNLHCLRLSGFQENLAKAL